MSRLSCHGIYFNLGSYMCFFTIIPFLCHICTSVVSLARYSLTTLPRSHFWRKGRNNSLVFTLPKFEYSFEVLEKDRDKAPLVRRFGSTCDPTPPCDRCLPPHACACPRPAPTPQPWPPLTSSAMAPPASSSPWPPPGPHSRRLAAPPTWPAPWSHIMMEFWHVVILLHSLFSMSRMRPIK